MTFLLRSPLGQIVLCVLTASVILLPALYVGRFSFAVTGLVVLSCAFLLFTRPLYTLLAYVMLIPCEELAVFANLGTPARLAGLLFFASYLFHRRFQINLRVMPFVAWLWLTWITASLMWSVTPNWQYYLQTLQLFMATLLIADFLSRSPEKLKVILNGYTLSSLVVTLFGIYNFFTHSGNISDLSNSSRISGFESQGVESFAFSLIPALLTTFHHVVTSKRTNVRWLNVVLTLIFATGMILSGTRGSWLATVGAVALVYLPRLKVRQYLTLITAVLLGIGTASQVPVIANFAQLRASDAISSGGAGRIGIWLVSWQMYLQNPVLGVGWWKTHEVMDLSHFERVRTNITWTEGGQGFRPRVSHNIYLQNLVELGIVGFLLYMFWIVSILMTPVHKDATLRNDWLIALAIFVAFLIGGLTNPELHKKYYWFALALPQGLRYYWLRFKGSQTTPLRQQMPSPAASLPPALTRR